MIMELNMRALSRSFGRPVAKLQRAVVEASRLKLRLMQLSSQLSRNKMNQLQQTRRVDSVCPLLKEITVDLLPLIQRLRSIRIPCRRLIRGLARALAPLQ